MIFKRMPGHMLAESQAVVSSRVAMSTVLALRDILVAVGLAG